MTKLYKWLTIYPGFLVECLQIYFSKKVASFLLVIILLGGLSVAAQSTGDLRSTGSTAWNITTTWERYNGTIWEASGVGANNPGQIPTAAGNVFIQSTHTVTLTSNAACNDLNIANGNVMTRSSALMGKIILGSNTLSVNGKFKCFFATINTIPGTDDNSFSVYPFTASGGKVSVEGNSRILTATGQWGLTISGFATGTFPLEINLNAGQTVTLNEGIKMSSLVINTGTLDAGTNRVAPDNGTTAQGNVTINSTGTFISAASGGTGNSVFSRTGTAATGVCGTFTLNGKMVLSGTSPQIQFISVVINSGSIIELSSTGASSQNFPTFSYTGAVAIPYFGSLTLSGSTAKSPNGNFSVLTDITISGTAVLDLTGRKVTVGGNWTSYGEAGLTESTSTIDFNGAGAQSINTSGGEKFLIMKKSGAGTLTLNSNVAFSNATSELNISNGVLDAGTFTLSGTASTALTMSAGTLKLAKLGFTLPEFSIGSFALSGSSTIELSGGPGLQTLQGARDYMNLAFSNAGIKRVSSNPSSITGTITVSDAATLDVENNTMGGLGTNLTMTGTSRYRTEGTATKPDAQGTYTLGAGTTVDFANMAATQEDVRLGTTYYNIEVSGSSVGNASTSPGTPITLQAGATFTVKNGGTFNAANVTGFMGGANTAINSLNSPVIVLETNSTVGYNGALAQNITGGITYQNLSVAGSGVKTAPASVLTVQGNLLKSGASTFDANGGTVLLNGANQSFAGLSYNNLRLDNAGTKTLSASATILDSLTIGNITNNPATALALGNSIYFTLKSTASKTARLGTVAPAASISYSGTGRFVVERHYPPRRAWRLLTAPITNDGNRNVFNSWQMGGAATSQSGLFVTGTMAPAGGLDVSPMNNYSFKTFDGLNMIGVDNTTSTLISGNTGSAGTPDNYGMFVFVRGDRSSNSLFYPPNSNQTTLRDTGKVQIKTQTFNFSGAVGGYTLIGNPFASEVNMNLVMASGTGIDNTIYYAYDPYLNLEQGGYLTYTADFSGAFTSTPPSPGGQKNYLYSSQAFFVKRTASSGSLTFTESNKSGGIALGAFRPQAAPQSFSVNLYLRDENDSTVLADGVKTLFDESFSNPENTLKAKKFININENLGLARDSEILAVEGRAPVTESDTMFLNVTHTALKNYQLRFEAGNPDPLMTAMLEDNYTGTKTPINLQSPGVYNFTVLDSGSSATDRFRIIFKANGTGPLPVIFSRVKAWQQTSKIAVEWTVENELNIDHYEVEKSTNTTGFTKANTTVATGNGQPTNVYRWLDPAMAEGNNYYRILYIEKNGKKGYSRTVNVPTGKTITGISIYPNPVKGGIIGLQFNNLPAGRYQARLINTLGQILFSKIITVGNGTSTQTIEPGMTLDKGICQLEITHPDKTVTVLKVVN